MLTNNNQKLFPLLIPSYMVDKIFTFRDPNKPEKGKVNLDHDTRPYRVIITNDGRIISEWMWDAEKGTVLFTPFKKVKEEHLYKGNVSRFFLQGTHGRYELLKHGSFIFPSLEKPINIFINQEKKTLFNDIFPFAKYLIQATAFQDKEIKQPDGSMLSCSKHRVDFVGLGWRKILNVKFDKDIIPIDVSVTMMVQGKEKGIHFKTIASNIENEKLIYPTSLKINHNKDIEIEIRRGNNE